MSLSSQHVHDIADALYEARRSRRAIDPISTLHPGLDEESAYGIQLVNANRELRAGRRLVGYKLGLTSREAQRQFKVFSPDFGHLFDDMCIAEESEIDLSTLLQPKIEGEIAFVMGRDLKGPGVTIVDVLSAVDYVMTAMEIVDSRIKDWKITGPDTIADNGSSALFVLAGRKVSLEGLDLPSVGMALSHNGEVAVTGAGAAVMGNPLSAVAFLANELGKHDRFLLAGEVILSGSLGAMLTVKDRDSFTCEIGNLGKVSVRFRRKEASA